MVGVKRRGIFPRELLLQSGIVLVPALFYLLATIRTVFLRPSSVFFHFHYIAIPFTLIACTLLRGVAEQSGWAMTQLAAPRTVRERVRATYLYTITACICSWAVCFAVTLLAWKFSGVILPLSMQDPNGELPLFYPLCFLLVLLFQIPVITLHLGRNSWTRSWGTLVVFGLVCILPTILLFLFSLVSSISDAYDVLQKRAFLQEVRNPLIALFVAGVLLIAVSWCISLLSEYKQLALRRPKWIKIVAVLCAVLCLGAGITGGWRTVHVARVRVAEERARIEAKKAERERGVYDSTSYTYAPHDKTAEEIEAFSELFAEESLLGKTRKDYEQRLTELKLVRTDDDPEETDGDGLRHVSHTYRMPESDASVYLTALVDTKYGTVTQFTAHFAQDLVLDALNYTDYRKILTDTAPGDREESFLRQQAVNGIYPEMINQRLNVFDSVEEHVYDFNVKLTSFLGVLNKDDLSADAAWLRLTVTVREGFVTEVTPMLTTSQSWETNYAKETEAALHAALTDFRSFAGKLESPVVGGSADGCRKMLTGLGYTTNNDLSWTAETEDRTVQFTVANDGKTVRTFQYGAPDTVKVVSRMSAAQADALRHCAPDGCDAAALHKALLKNELLPRAILEYADQTGTVQREYVCELLLTQDYDTTTQRSITFTYILRDGKLAETRMEFIPPLDTI